MTTTTTIVPSSSLAGSWELVQPLPVNGSTYVEPKILATVVAGYFGGDANANGLVQDQLVLPDVGISVGQIDLIGTGKLDYTGTYTTSWNVPSPTMFPGYTVKAGDLFIVDGASLELTDPGPPTTPASPWQTRGSWWTATPYVPRITRFFKMATADGESGAVTVTGPSNRMHWTCRVLRGVDIAAYFDAGSATNTHGQGSRPNPASIVTATAGAYVETVVAGNAAGGIGTPPPGYNQGVSFTSGIDRGFGQAWTRRPTPGTEDPGQWGGTLENWRAVTDVYKPAVNSGLTLIVLGLVSDTTATAVPGSPFTAQSEVQRISSLLTSGTFTLTWNGQTTSALNFDASASTIQAALIALSNIGATDVSCFGGPLHQGPVTVVFQNGLANQDVAMITTSSGSVTVTEIEKGHPVYSFAWEGSVNCPRWADGPAWLAGSAPQINIWGLRPPSYIAGTEVDVSVSDHNGNQTWALMLLVIKDANPNNPISDTFGSAAGKLAGTDITFGTITPPTPGSKVVAILGQSTAALYGSPPSTSPPARYKQLARATSDRSVLTTYLSPPAAAAPESPGKLSWTGAQDVVCGLMAIDPAGTAGTLTMAQVLASTSLNTYIELAFAAGSMYEVVEFDLSGLPANPWLLSARLDFAHSSAVRNPLRAMLVGIRADGTIVPAVEQRPGGYIAEPLGQVQTQLGSVVTEFSDGSPISDFTRLGAVFISSERHPQLESHKLYWASCSLTFEPGRPVVSAVTGPDTPGAPITWNYSSTSGLAQAEYEVLIIAGSGQDPETAVAAPSGLMATTGQIIYRERSQGPSVRSVSLTDQPLGRGACTVAVRAWAVASNGSLIPSEWDTDDFDISGVPPTVPPQVGSWEVIGHQTFDGNGDPFRSAGMNGGVPIFLPDGHTGKFGGTGAKVTAWAYEGYGGPPSYHISPDIWPGPVNVHSGNTIMPGGYFIGYNGWSQQLLGWTDVPDRAAAMFGYLSPAAQALGVTMPSGRSWKNRLVRLNCHPKSGPYTWIQGTDPNAITNPAAMITQYKDQALAHAALGYVVNIEYHEMTGTDPVLPAGLVSDPMLSSASLAAGPIKDMILFYDELCAALQGGTHNVWIGLPNEAYASARSLNYDDFIVTLIRRIRGKGFGGIITWPLPQFAGNVALLASGGLDDLIARFASHGVGHNLRPELHFYGTDYASFGTGAAIDATYATTKAQFEKLVAGSGGANATAYQHALYIGEYGRPTPDGSWDPGLGPALNATLNARTIVAVDIMAGTAYGTPLGELFPDFDLTFWNGTGDNTWRRNFTLTWGSVNKGSQTGPDPHTSNVGHPSGTFPPHDIPYLADPNEWLSVAGQRHWYISDRIAIQSTTSGGGGSRASLNPETGAVDVQVITPAGVSRAWLLRSLDGGSSWAPVGDGPYTVPASAASTLIDSWCPVMEETVTYAVSFDAGPMTETTVPVVLGDPIDTDTTAWFLIVPTAPAMSTRIEVAGVKRVQPIRSVVASQPQGSVVASSRPLPEEITLDIRTRNAAQREMVDAALTSGRALRLVNILGQEWLVRVTGDISRDLQRWAPLNTERTGLRDAHVISVSFTEVTR